MRTSPDAVGCDIATIPLVYPDAPLAHPNATLARSSPSPPPASRRLSHSARNARPVRSSLVVTSRNGAPSSSSTGIALDWSTSYQASASSGADAFYESSTASEEDDSEPETARGRAHDTTHIRLPTLSPTRPIRLQPVPTGSILRARKGSEGAAARKNSGSSADVAPASSSPTTNSAAAPANTTSENIPAPAPRSASPVALIRPSSSALKQTKPRQLPAVRTFVTLLPTACRLRVNVPCTRLALDLNLDVRAASEVAILLGAVHLACTKLASFPEQISAAVGGSIRSDAWSHADSARQKSMSLSCFHCSIYSRRTLCPCSRHLLQRLCLQMPQSHRPRLFLQFKSCVVLPGVSADSRCRFILHLQNLAVWALLFSG